MTGDVLTRIEGRLGRITLNRAAALHALTEPMCAKMIAALLAWRDDPEVTAVLIDHAVGTRGFCAGGDIRMIAESVRGDGVAAHGFFRAEYQLDDLIQGYAKPTVALIDGVTMGGGVGISVHARYRVATERTRFAMPETGIGLFPDVGGGWFLPRLPGRIGTWLGLTGTIIEAADCLEAGIATHYALSASLGDVREKVAAAARVSPDNLPATLASISIDAGPLKALAVESRAKIDALFAFGTVEEIVAALNVDGSPWAQAQRATIATKSPRMTKATLRLLRAGEKFTSFADDMRVEFRIAMRAIQHHDFLDGVRAVVIDRDGAPRWAPATLEGVTDKVVDEIFAPLPAAEEWAPLR